MNTSKTKKGLSVLLAIIMLFSTLSTAFTTLGAEKAYPVMKAYSYVPVNNLPDYHAYRESIVTATFLDEIDTTGAYMVWDISASAETGTVKAWIKESSTEAGKYDLYIGGEGGVAANTLSSNVFYNFVNLKEVAGLENFKTGNATTLDCLFENCASLTTLDLSSFDTTNVTNLSYLLSGCTSLESVNFANWDTSKVTNMGYMFNNCVTLPVLDLSGFNTKKVTNMKRMFYRCEKLTTLYTGDDWSVDQLSESNSGEMFNCCYVIEGKKSFEKVAAPYNKQYANYDGFLTYKAPAPTEYTVSYEIIGNVGPKDNVPETFKYNAGSLVSVESALEAEGYTFSGWTTEDAEVEDGKFTINNNVHFVGSWSKLYKVTYVYDDNYAVPENAPALPDEEAYTANTSVAVKDIPFVEGYTFVGWDTEDADVTADGKFLMPEKDVVLYGFFKKPVEGLVVNGNVHDINLNMIDNKETVINVVVTPPDATIQNVTFTSSNPEVAEVDENGKITAKSEGTTTITIKTTDGSEIQVDINVTVKNPVIDITVDKKDVELYVGETDKITGTVNESATNKNVIYESTDSTIAEVDKDGNIIAKGEGTTTIIVKSEDDETIVETVTVTVKNPVTEITAPENITLYIDEIKNIDAKVNDDATVKDLYYDSDDHDVVKVDNEGNIVPQGKGTTKVTITSKDDPSITTTVTVTVVPRQYEVTYEFIGEIQPENVTAPAGAVYDEGTTVTVETDASAEGYIFSGWTTEDAEVEDGKFTLNNDIHFVGSWTKLYKVTYEYEGEVPAEAPELPAAEKYTAGKEVDVKAVPSVDGYTFTGWYTSDATVENGKFTMPEKDVVLKGKFEKIINYYNVEYKYEGEVPADAPTYETKAYEEGTTVTVEAEPSVDGYRFLGWSKNGSFVLNEDVVIIGKWEKINYYNVEYKYEGEVPDGAPTYETKTYEEGSNVIVEGNPSVDGYTFSGWTTADADITGGNFDIYNNVVIIGSWTKNPVYYNVEYKYEGEVPAGAPTYETKTYEKGTTVTVEAEPSVDGYRFLGWSNNGSFVLNEDVVIIGKWEKINYYNVEYKYEGEVPADAPTYETKTYEEGTTVTVEAEPSVDGYKFLGWSKNGSFVINNNVVIIGKWEKLPGPVTEIIAPEKITIVLGEEKMLEASVNTNAVNKALYYMSNNESIVKIDENGKMTTVGAGTALITVASVENPSIYKVVEVTVTAKPAALSKHYIVFGKTEKIGWYSVSLDGGKTFFTQFGNDHLEVEKGTEIIVKANDVFGDPFTFYVNGNAVTPDENGYVRILVNDFILIGALGIPVVAPDAEESLNFIQKFIKAIKDFFAKIAAFFKF